MKRLLAVATAGGHWEELMLLRPALDPFHVEYATTNPDLAKRDGIARMHVLPDANRDRPVRGLYCLWRAWRIVRLARPDIVVTTGALPGLICAVAGRLSGARTIWIDSIANSVTPSFSGWCASFFADLWLTQWQHLACDGRSFEGALL